MDHAGSESRLLILSHHTGQGARNLGHVEAEIPVLLQIDARHGLERSGGRRRSGHGAHVFQTDQCQRLGHAVDAAREFEKPGVRQLQQTGSQRRIGTDELANAFEIRLLALQFAEQQGDHLRDAGQHKLRRHQGIQLHENTTPVRTATMAGIIGPSGGTVVQRRRGLCKNAPPAATLADNLESP